MNTIEAPPARNRRAVDLTGRVFNQWTAVRPIKRVIASGGRVFRRTDWECRCSCGTIKLIAPGVLLCGDARSCGCVTVSPRAAVGGAKRAPSHGMARKGAVHPIYNAWRNMMTRCYNKNRKQWKDHGGRGITVDPLWHDPKAFIDDMLPEYKPGLTLDRIRNNEGYSKGNCRWVSKAEQQRNKTTNVFIDTPEGVLCVSEAVRKYGPVSIQTVLYRLRRGWSERDALFTPPAPGKTGRPRKSI